VPQWRQVLAVVAHSDDETFALGAIADSFAAGGTSVHVLCFTHGKASALNENDAELGAARTGNCAMLQPSWVSPPSPCSITPMAI
jgi:LmbE family N-acetylglucosaminyl deacetylase